MLEHTRLPLEPFWWMPLHKVVLLHLVRWMLKLMRLHLKDKVTKLVMLFLRVMDNPDLFGNGNGRMLA